MSKYLTLCYSGSRAFVLVLGVSRFNNTRSSRKGTSQKHFNAVDARQQWRDASISVSVRPRLVSRLDPGLQIGSSPLSMLDQLQP